VAKKLYKVFHNTLIEVLAGWGIRASLCGDVSKRRREDEPFLCFQRRSEGDALLNGSKIAGSAQRRHRGAVLQHGSVLLRTSSCAPELIGIEELSETTLEFDEVIELWTAQICSELGIITTIAALDEEKVSAARQLEGDRFGSDRWTNRR
jgi:lipoate-protein ligase A